MPRTPCCAPLGPCRRSCTRTRRAMSRVLSLPLSGLSSRAPPPTTTTPTRQLSWSSPLPDFCTASAPPLHLPPLHPPLHTLCTPSARPLSSCCELYTNTLVVVVPRQPRGRGRCLVFGVLLGSFTWCTAPRTTITLNLKISRIFFVAFFVAFLDNFHPCLDEIVHPEVYSNNDAPAKQRSPR